MKYIYSCLTTKVWLDVLAPNPAMSSSLVRASPSIHVRLVSVVVFRLAVKAPVVPIVASVISCGAISVSIYSISGTLLIASVWCFADSVNCFFHIRS